MFVFWREILFQMVFWSPHLNQRKGFIIAHQLWFRERTSVGGTWTPLYNSLVGRAFGGTLQDEWVQVKETIRSVK